MYIERVEIKNFRCFDDKGVTFLFNKGVNAIIGENNTGKSALVDALKIAFTILNYNREVYFSLNDFHIDIRGERASNAQIDVYLKEVPLHQIDLWNPDDPDTGEFHIFFWVDKLLGGTERVRSKIWGGRSEGNTLTSTSFDSMNVVALEALRDAEKAMRPSRTSRIASLLKSILPDEADRKKILDKLDQTNQDILSLDPIQNIEKIINENLESIERDILRQRVQIGLVEPRFDSFASSLRSWVLPRWLFVHNTDPVYNEMYKFCNSIVSLKPVQENTEGFFLDLHEIRGYVSTAPQVVQDFVSESTPPSYELGQNGLGYNNLLFMATVLGDLSQVASDTLLSLLLIEEPEAHLHPQLQKLIHNFFEEQHRGSDNVQIIYTSHSPTLVSKVGIKAINLLYEDSHSIKNFPLVNNKLDENDQDYLEKYLDVTKSQLFFAKGIIFVEGISEALLIPEFAKLLGRDLDKYAVEVVNVDGTSFKPFANLLTNVSGVGGFVRSCVITDDDRCTTKGDNYISKESDFDTDLDKLLEAVELGAPSERYVKISELCEGTNIKVFPAKVTLEYEFASHEENIPFILSAILEIYPQAGQKLKERVYSSNEIKEKALMIWLFIRSRDKSKAQIAQILSRLIQALLSQANENVVDKNTFIVPDYIADAIYSVTQSKDKVGGKN